MDYDQACKAATTAQGLDPVVARLTTEGLPVTIEQTGGMTMVAYVRAGDDPRHLGITYGYTDRCQCEHAADDHDGPPLAGIGWQGRICRVTWCGCLDYQPGYLVVAYTDATDDGTIIDETAELEHVADYVRGFLRGCHR